MTPKLRFLVDKDAGNPHYTWLLPLDDFTESHIAKTHWPVYMDGMEVDGVVVLYNGRDVNRKNGVLQRHISVLKKHLGVPDAVSNKRKVR